VNGRPRITTLFLLSGTLLFSHLFTTSSFASPISSKKAQLREVQAKLQAVYQKVDVAVEKYNQARSQLETVKKQIGENQRLLKVAEYNLEVANRQLTARAENMYRSRDVSVVDVLFAASSFDDLVTQRSLMERLGNSDVDTVHAIAAYKREIKDRRLRLKADEKAATRLVAERERHRNELVALESDLRALTKKIKKQIKKLKAQARLRAQLALTGYSGPIPEVDPNSPGHPEIIAIAKRYFGVPYVWGGASPSGFDCSGLTMYCYAQIGVNLYHGATMQQRASSPVALTDMRPGDLIFFGNASFSHHVAIFVGGTTCIEAPHTGDVVRYGTWTGRDAWIGGRF